MMILEGLHYGNVKTKHNSYIWLATRLYYWKIDKAVLKRQHSKHCFKDSWIREHNIATVEDTPQNNSVYVTKLFDSDSINNTTEVKLLDQLKPVLRAKYTKTKRYRQLKNILNRLSSAMFKSISEKWPHDNVILVSYQHPKIYRYAELEHGKIKVLGNPIG